MKIVHAVSPVADRVAHFMYLINSNSKTLCHKPLKTTQSEFLYFFFFSDSLSL